MINYLFPAMLFATVLGGLLPAAQGFRRLGWVSWSYALLFALLFGVSGANGQTNCIVVRELLFSLALLTPVITALLIWFVSRSSMLPKNYPLRWFVGVFAIQTGIWIGSLRFFDEYLNSGCA